MNILTAPVQLMAEAFQISSGLIEGSSGATTPGSSAALLGVWFRFFLQMATSLTFILALAGVYLLVVGTPGDIEIGGKSLTIKTGTAGLGLVVLALLFYLAIGKMIMNRMKD